MSDERNTQQPAPTQIKVLAWPFQANSTLNPYQKLLYNGVAELGETDVYEFSPKRLYRSRWDIVHIHWPDGFWPRHNWAISLAYSLMLLLGLVFARWRGAKLVWTTHNVAAHERKNDRLRKLYMRAFTNLCDAIINLSHENHQSSVAAYPNLDKVPYRIVQHGLYDDHYPQHDLTWHECRAALDLPPEGGLILAIGNIRPYKGYDQLIASFNAMPGDIQKKWTLLIVGKANQDEYLTEITQQAGDTDRIIIRNMFVPDEDISLYFGAANLTALPYRVMQNSGVAYLSLGFGAPVFAPDMNSFIDLHRYFPSMVELFDGEVTAGKLQNALAEHDNAQDLLSPDWRPLRREISEVTRDFFHELIGEPQ